MNHIPLKDYIKILERVSKNFPDIVMVFTDKGKYEAHPVRQGPTIGRVNDSGQFELGEKAQGKRAVCLN